MNRLKKTTLIFSVALTAIALILLASGEVGSRALAAGMESAAKQENQPGIAASGEVYVPVSVVNYPYFSPFGAESNNFMIEGTNVYNKGLGLGLKWTRLGRRVMWNKLQPTEGGPIDWSKLAKFEQELRSLKEAGITPVVIISDSPYWATVKPTSCAAIREDKLPAFESFVRAVVARYKRSEYNVHNWEIGNEPDVDPSLVNKDSVFGCWGKISDPYYGGELYGKMLKRIGPAIKQVDPSARVWFGGLLLASPSSSAGKPELFLQGALLAGAGPYFDVLGYHWYPPYENRNIDYDLYGNLEKWKDYGGGTIGKANFLRSMLTRHGYNKFLVLNETSLMCPPSVNGQPTSYCNPPGDAFYQAQANYQVRSFVRGLSAKVIGFSWYTLNGPGWRNTGLLDKFGMPRPSYDAYKHMITRLNQSRYLYPVNYGPGLEAYSFDRYDEVVHVVWSKENTSLPITVPKFKLIAIYDRDGKQLTPTLVGNNYTLNVGFKPVYVIRKP